MYKTAIIAVLLLSSPLLSSPRPSPPPRRDRPRSGREGGPAAALVGHDEGAGADAQEDALPQRKLHRLKQTNKGNMLKKKVGNGGGGGKEVGGAKK